MKAKYNFQELDEWILIMHLYMQMYMQMYMQICLHVKLEPSLAQLSPDITRDS